MPVCEPYFQHHDDDEGIGLSSSSSSRRSTAEPQQERLYRVRERQWIYLGPIAAAPLAHIGVTLYRSAVTPFHKQLIMGGVVASTVLAVGMRLVLMVHAGYPGGPNRAIIERERLVSMNEKQKMEQASVLEIAKAAAKGFG